MPTSSSPPFRRSVWAAPGRTLALGALLLVAALPGTPRRAQAAPVKPLLLAVLGSGQDAGRLQAAIDGARVAAEAIPSEGVLAGGAQVRGFDTGGSPAGFQKALKEVRAAKAAGVIAVPAGDQHLLYWKAARSLRVPWASVAGLSPDGERNPGNLFHVGPTVVGQAIVAADTLLAPLAARRVAILHEPSDLGRELAAGVSRNLSPHVTLAGIQTWESDSGAGALQSLRGLEAGWVYVGLNGAPLHHFLAALAAGTWRPRLLFAEGARDESLLTAAGDALEGCVFLGGPDPELQGRLGESLVRAFERAGRPLEVVGVRAFEAARRLLTGFAAADGVKLKAVWAALDLETPQVGVLGRLGFSHPGAVRFFPLTLWRVEKGRYEPWPAGLLPTGGCGPPLGFGPPRPAAVHPKGKLAVLTYGSEDKRTIEADLLAIGLSTGGATPALDALVRDEILARAIRIANRLFRREADGTPIAGWSWGMGFATTPPAEDVKRSRLWLAICAGDHPDAGGQAFGSWVAVYTSFLKRTMYERRKLDPVLSAADLPLLDGSYRWGSDRASNFRADKIRCLMDGFASAMGLTLSHELGHLCGCGHDTEHPTSIMNVVAGAGASWEEAVWIPRHERKVTTTLGVEALPR